MLEIEFAQAIRSAAGSATTTRITSAAVAPRRRSRGPHTGLAVRAGGRRGRPRRGEVASATGGGDAARRISQAHGGERSAFVAAAAAGAAGQHTGLRNRHGERPGRVATWRPPGGLRAALRPGGGRARRAIRAATDPARPRQALTRDHTVVNEQMRLGLITAGEAADRQDQPRAEPLAGHRPCS